MKIDLHCHTKKTKSGDPETRNVTKDVFLKKLSNASVAIAAITNHNSFDLNQFNDFSSNDKGIMVFPGVELDIKGKVSSGHCILIASPDNPSTFDVFVKNLIGTKSADEFECEIDDFISRVKDNDYIVIPHYDKPHSLSEEDIKLLKDGVGDVPVLLEPANLRSAGIMIANNQSSIIGSDVRDWNKYGEAHLPELKISISGYAQFHKLLKKDIPTIETFVKSKFAEEVHIHPVQYPDCDVKFDIYNDINVIFGGKGTGKTELILKEIRDHFVAKGYSDVSEYFPNDEDNIQDFNKLKTIDPKFSDLAKITSDNLVDDFATITNHSEVPVTSTSEYFKWLSQEKTKGRVFGFASSTFIEPLEVLKKNYESEVKHYADTQKVVSDMKKVAVEPYLPVSEIKNLESLLLILINSSWKTVVESFSTYNAAYLTKWSVEKFKTLYQNKKGVRVKPTQTGFVSLFENSLKLYNAADKIQKAMCSDSKIEKPVIGVLIDKGSIFREIKYSMNPADCSARDPKSSYFSNKMNKGNMETFKKKIDALVQNSFSINEPKAIVDFKTTCGSWNITDLSCLLFCNTRIVDEQNNSYDPSPGEKAMLLLNYKLMDDSKNVYILDEPEAKVGHKYINDVIIPRLLELSRKDKKVILTTHDANIAVRTLPLRSVYREQYRISGDPTPKYRTYIGSPFLDKMTCYEDPSKTLDWVKISMDTLEGGVDAFIEREENYNYGR